MKILLQILLIIFLLGLPPNLSAQEVLPSKPTTSEAQKLFSDYQNNVYQIRVIDLATGKKAAIGSGFRISQDGYIVTNYHVIASVVHRPKLFRLEFLDAQSKTGNLTILDIDIIHDLAIVKSEEQSESFLPLSNDEASKGSRIFSMGNPLDLGMSIIEGTYNGLMEKSMYKKILFSGSLNPGMSGGPALNANGEVVGVNVATSREGEQISFLVPVEYLKILWEKVKAANAEEKNWHQDIEMQLADNQINFIDRLLKESWDTVPMGNAFVPGEISDEFRCWSNSRDVEDARFKSIDLNCSTQDIIFIDDSLYTGNVAYRYYWLKSKDLHTFGFFTLLEKYFAFDHDFMNADKEDAENFDCHTNFVQVADQSWKVSLCARPYKKYPSLYDVDLVMTTVNHAKKALVVEMVALGLTKAKAMEFAKRFMEEIHWKE